MALQAETERFAEFAKYLAYKLREVGEDDQIDVAFWNVTVGPPVGNSVWITANDEQRGVTFSLEPWGDWERHVVEPPMSAEQFDREVLLIGQDDDE